MKSSLVYATCSLAVAALMAGGYCAARPPPNSTGQGVASQRVETQFAVQIGPPAELEVSSLPLLKIARGDTISIAVESSQTGQLMVHGYTQEMVRVTAGQTAVIRVVALHAGRYALHLHGDDQTHREAAILEISP